MNILVTGGAGYVGSCAARRLVDAGHRVVSYDNLSTGHRWAVLNSELVVGDVADQRLLTKTLLEHEIEIVMHFAAYSEVGESVRDPLNYYMNNTRNAVNLLVACEHAGVNRFVFSSTAAVYGQPQEMPIPESAVPAPVNPYGASKVAVERMLADLSAAGRVRYVSLRYFNAAGASPDARIGEWHTPETHLIPLLLQAASGRRDKFTIFGTDYATPDGTCIRDFIHIEDIATAHRRAAEYLHAGGESTVLNCGYGRGFSVREVVEAARSVSGVDIPVEHTVRRLGDPPVLVADNRKIREVLSWVPEFDDLDTIIRHSWAWEQRMGYDE